MTTQLLTLFTRTPLHVGAGASVGAVDQPVVRERHTRFPVIPGSALKGVLADLWLEKNEKGEIVRSKEGKDLFGFDEKQTKENPGYAGSLYIGESKLLAFPVRSAKGCFAWITCPTALRRFDREASAKLPLDGLPAAAMDAMVSDALKLGDGKAAFEEYVVTVKGHPDGAIVKALAELSGDPLWSSGLGDKLAIVSDELFQYFAENACEIAQHNRIDDESHVVDDGALFNQENVPSESMFYAVLRSNASGDFNELSAKLESVGNVVQIGADVTTGLGWCTVTLREVL